MNQNVLISTALLCAMWDKHNKDTLDLMIPFLKYSIAKQTSIGKVLDVEAIITHFKSEFGYDTIPHNVINLMLKRLSPDVLRRNNGKYTLLISLDAEVSDFEGKRAVYKERRNKVGTALANHLNEHMSKISTPYTCESALTELINFFVKNGLALAQNPKQLSLIKRTSDEKVEYCIARYIIEEYRNETEIFDYITNMVNGFFVSTAITFQPDNLSMPHSKFKNLDCYLDTRVILDALGLRLSSGKTAAIELIEMLRSEQATVCCFQHTVNEIRDIITAYRKRLLNPRKFSSLNTLEYWDEQNYSAEQVTRYLLLLEKKIEDLNIKIVPSTTKLDTFVKGIKAVKFQKELKTMVQYHSETAYSNDVLSVMGIMCLRNGQLVAELEKCNHIFVTTNIPLVNVVQRNLKDYDGYVPPVISDGSMSSIVWFKCCYSHKDYPKHKLIDNAMLALEPSISVLKEFHEEVNHLQAEGELTNDEAAIILTDIHLKRELAESVQGDASLINKDVIIQMRTRLRERYIAEETSAAEENYQRYLSQKARSNQALDKIINQIENTGKQKREFVVKILSPATKLGSIVLFLVCVRCTVVTYSFNTGPWFASLLPLVISLLGLYDVFSGRKHIVRKWIDKIATHVADHAMEKKRKEYAEVIDSLTTPSKSL